MRVSLRKALRAPRPAVRVETAERLAQAPLEDDIAIVGSLRSAPDSPGAMSGP